MKIELEPAMSVVYKLSNHQELVELFVQANADKYGFNEDGLIIDIAYPQETIIVQEFIDDINKHYVDCFESLRKYNQSIQGLTEEEFKDISSLLEKHEEATFYANNMDEPTMNEHDIDELLSNFNVKRKSTFQTTTSPKRKVAKKKQIADIMDQTEKNFTLYKETKSEMVDLEISISIIQDKLEAEINKLRKKYNKQIVEKQNKIQDIQSKLVEYKSRI